MGVEDLMGKAPRELRSHVLPFPLPITPLVPTPLSDSRLEVRGFGQVLPYAFEGLFRLQAVGIYWFREKTGVSGPPIYR